MVYLHIIYIQFSYAGNVKKIICNHFAAFETVFESVYSNLRSPFSGAHGHALWAPRIGAYLLLLL